MSKKKACVVLFEVIENMVELLSKPASEEEADSVATRSAG